MYGEFSGKEIVHAVVNFSAGYDDAEGALKIMSALQTDSYLWEPECHLTGAFAVYTWLKGAHAHDFVLTIGGYAPLFEKIRESQYPHYPSVERVGINWILNEYVSVTGNAYVALTPSCLMAGGNLSLSFLDGKLKAWLVAYVDFLMQWKPWNYDLSLGVSIGASYRLDLGFIHKTFQIELAASIHFWGPPFQGRAKIDWWIISFTISFGKSEKDGPEVTFGDVEAMLAEKSTDVGSICQIRLVKGLLEQYSECEYVADSEDLRLEIHTQIPVCRLKVMQNEDETAAFVIQAQKQLFVLPMGEETCLTSDLEIRVKRDNGQAFSMQTEAIYENVPYALWGEKRVMQPSADMILDVPVGVALFTQIVDSAEYLPLKGQYEERVLNGIGCGFQDKVPVVICPKEAGKTYTKEKMNWENIWKSFPGKEDHKAMLAACYGLEAEYVRYPRFVLNETEIYEVYPPEIGIWKNHDFQNEFQIRVRNKKDESIVLHQGWLLQFNYWCGTGAGALVASDDEKKIHYIVDDQLKEKLVEQNDTEESEQQNEKFSICKSEFELEISTFKRGEAVGVGYHIFVMWRTVGADMVFLNEESVSAEGGKGILMDRNECEKQGEIRVSLIAQNKYGASVRKELSLKPSGPVIKRWEAVEETHDNVTSRYCCWKVLYADQIIYNDKDGYKAEDKELCKVTHYGHPDDWSGQLFDGKLRAIGFGGMVTEVTYHDSIDYPPVI